MKKNTSDYFLIGLTGGIACGKTKVLGYLGELGYETFNADEYVHNCLRSDGFLYNKVLKVFGNNILDSNGEISRKNLGNLIFLDDKYRLKLNNIVHPIVKKRIQSWIKECQLKHKNGVAEIPLLFECGYENFKWDCIAVVYANENIIIDRLKKRGLSEVEAIYRIKSQWNINDKCKKADILINGNGNKKELKKIVNKFVQEWTQERNK